MARKIVLLDDFDGSTLPDDTKPVRLSLGAESYELHLSPTSHEKLNEALNPFIKDAEPIPPASVGIGSKIGTGSKRASTAATERNKKVREWAQTTGYEYAGADGTMRTLGDRGRVPDVVIKAWEEAGEPS